MAEQLIFDLPVRNARGRDAFFVSPANALALAMVDCWPNWPDGRLLICGGPGAGKSHLAAVWAERAGARVVTADGLRPEDVPPLLAQDLVVEDIDIIAPEQERALFHLINLARAEGRSLLLTAVASTSAHGLPDLQSRLNATTQVVLGPPDDALLSALLVKLFADRQIKVDPTLIPYLLHRMERSTQAAGLVVQRLDAAGLARKQPLTRALARDVLEGDLS